MSPAGSVFANATPVRPLLFGLLITNVKVVLLFSAMEGTAKEFVIVGAVRTLIGALAIFPTPPFADAIAPVMFVKSPPAMPLMLTLNEQAAATAALDRLTLLAPEFAVMVPPHVSLRTPPSPTTIPLGRLSVKPTPRSAMAFGFAIVNVSTVVPFKGIRGSVNAFVNCGGARTSSVAFADKPFPPSVDVTSDVVFAIEPAAVAITFMLNAQD
jgi:hypothetical protein